MQQQQQPQQRQPSPPLDLYTIVDAIRPALAATLPVFCLTLWMRVSPNATIGMVLLALPFVLAAYFGGRHADRRLAAVAGAAFVLIAPNMPALFLMPFLAALAVAGSLLRHNNRG